MITVDRLSEVVKYDPLSGVFCWATTRKGCSAGKEIGTLKDNGYLHFGIDGKKYLVHRLAWLYVYGEMPPHDIDHIDGCRTNNAIKNLRSVDRSTNLENIKCAKSHNKSTGLLGAYLHKSGRFMSRITIKGKDSYLGLFKSKEEAHQAYIDAKRLHHAGNML